MCVLVMKSQVGMLLAAWWMFMAVISLGALRNPKAQRQGFERGAAHRKYVRLPAPEYIWDL